MSGSEPGVPGVPGAAGGTEGPEGPEGLDTGGLPPGHDGGPARGALGRLSRTGEAVPPARTAPGHRGLPSGFRPDDGAPRREAGKRGDCR
ncbi:hypothetical protein GCM10018782_06650 [Streptomyces griseoaurantiacus]|nr:hypothetical protein GCM10018782_06650 [Streptomyces griseoaurantiacus]